MIQLSGRVKEIFPQAKLLYGDKGLVVRCKRNGGECITSLTSDHEFSIKTARTQKRVLALLSPKSGSCKNCVGGTK